VRFRTLLSTVGERSRALSDPYRVATVEAVTQDEHSGFSRTVDCSRMVAEAILAGGKRQVWEAWRAERYLRLATKRADPAHRRIGATEYTSALCR